MINSINIVFPNTAAEAEKLPDIQKKALAALFEQYPDQTRFEKGSHTLRVPIIIDGNPCTKVTISNPIIKTQKKSNPLGFTYRVLDPMPIAQGGANEINDNPYKINIKGPSVIFGATKRPKVNRHSLNKTTQSYTSCSFFNDFYGHCRWVDDTNVLLPNLPGENLEKRLTRQPKFAPENAATIAFGCARRVEMLHCGGYTHGDIKAGNIIVNDTIPTIIDFDNFRPIENVNTTKQPEYTLHYSAPEIYQQVYKLYKGIRELVEYNAVKTDIYALGVTLLEVFAGKSFYSYLEILLSQQSIILNNMYQTDGIIDPNCLNYQLIIWLHLKKFINEIPEDRCPKLLKSFLRRMVSQNPNGSLNPNPNDRPSIQEVVAALLLNQMHILTPETLNAVAQLSQIDLLTSETLNAVIELSQIGLLTPETLNVVIELSKINLLTPETLNAIIDLNQSGLLTKETLNAVILLSQTNLLTSKTTFNDIYDFSLFNEQTADINKRLKKCSSLEEIKKLIKEAECLKSDLEKIKGSFNNNDIPQSLLDYIGEVLDDAEEKKESFSFLYSCITEINNALPTCQKPKEIEELKRAAKNLKEEIEALEDNDGSNSKLFLPDSIDAVLDEIATKQEELLKEQQPKNIGFFNSLAAEEVKAPSQEDLNETVKLQQPLM